MTTIQQSTHNGRHCTHILGGDVAGTVERRESDTWLLDVTIREAYAAQIVSRLPDCVTFESLSPGYWRLSAMLDSSSVTNTLTVLARLN